MAIVVGYIQPHTFKPVEAARLLEGVREAPRDPSPEECNQATRMANAAQALWDELRDTSLADLEDGAIPSSLTAQLVKIKKVMGGKP